MKASKEHSDKALELISKGDVKGAIQEQIKAIEANPSDPELLVNLIGFHRDDGDIKKAKDLAEEALRIIPNNAWVNSYYAEMLERENNYEEALKYRLRAVELDSTNCSFISSLGSTQESLGDRKSARINFQKALNIEPNDMFTLLRLGQLEEDEGNPKEAIILYERVLAVPVKNYRNADEVFAEEAREKLNNLKAKKP